MPNSWRVAFSVFLLVNLASLTLSIHIRYYRYKSSIGGCQMSLTKRQKQVLGFIRSFTGKNDYAPTFEEIAHHLGLSSISTAHYHVSALEDAGYLSKEENQPRS